MKKRKRSPRPTRYRGRLKRPGQVSALKALWADPEWRAMMMEKRKAAGLKMRGSIGRYGVPDGMRKAEADKLNLQAQESAKETMAALEKAGVTSSDDDAAKEALRISIEIMRRPGDRRVRLSAARQVLDFTKAKPATKSDITVNKAEEWLAAVATENNDGDKGKSVADAEASA